MLRLLLRSYLQCKSSKYFLMARKHLQSGSGNKGPSPRPTQTSFKIGKYELKISSGRERDLYYIYISDRNNMHMRAYTHTDILVIHHSNPFIFSDAFSPARGKREGNPTIFSHFHVHLPLHDLTKK